MDIVTSHFYVRRTRRGFTLVELVVVMILIGILGAMGASRYFEHSSFDASGFAAQTTAMMRYAQKLAIAQNRSVFVRLDGGGVALFVCNQNTPNNNCVLVPVPAPSGGNSAKAKTLTYCGSSTVLCEAAPDNISYSTSPTGVTGFFFDAQGRPFAATDHSDDVYLSTFVTLTLTITGDGLTRTVTVVPETGYVY